MHSLGLIQGCGGGFLGSWENWAALAVIGGLAVGARSGVADELAHRRTLGEPIPELRAEGESPRQALPPLVLSARKAPVPVPAPVPEPHLARRLGRGATGTGRERPVPNWAGLVYQANPNPLPRPVVDPGGQYVSLARIPDRNPVLTDRIVTDVVDPLALRPRGHGTNLQLPPPLTGPQPVPLLARDPGAPTVITAADVAGAGGAGSNVVGAAFLDRVPGGLQISFLGGFAASSLQLPTGQTVVNGIAPRTAIGIPEYTWSDLSMTSSIYTNGTHRVQYNDEMTQFRYTRAVTMEGLGAAGLARTSLGELSVRGDGGSEPGAIPIATRLRRLSTATEGLYPEQSSALAARATALDTARTRLDAAYTALEGVRAGADARDTERLIREAREAGEAYKQLLEEADEQLLVKEKKPGEDDTAVAAVDKSPTPTGGATATSTSATGATSTSGTSL